MVWLNPEARPTEKVLHKELATDPRELALPTFTPQSKPPKR